LQSFLKDHKTNEATLAKKIQKSKFRNKIT